MMSWMIISSFATLLYLMNYNLSKNIRHFSANIYYLPLLPFSNNRKTFFNVVLFEKLNRFIFGVDWTGTNKLSNVLFYILVFIPYYIIFYTILTIYVPVLVGVKYYFRYSFGYDRILKVLIDENSDDDIPVLPMFYVKYSAIVGFLSMIVATFFYILVSLLLI